MEIVSLESRLTAVLRQSEIGFTRVGLVGRGDDGVAGFMGMWVVMFFIFTVYLLKSGHCRKIVSTGNKWK